MTTEEDDFDVIDVGEGTSASTDQTNTVYQYELASRKPIKSDSSARASQQERFSNIAQKIYDVTWPATTIQKLVDQENNLYRQSDLMVCSAASGIDLFKLATLSLDLRNKYYFSAPILSESLLPDTVGKTRSTIEPKGKQVILTRNGKPDKYRISALFNLPHGRFAMQIGSVVHSISSGDRGAKDKRASVPIIMLSQNYMRMAEEFDKETHGTKGASILNGLQTLWSYQLHDHIHALVRDFDDSAPAEFSRFDYSIHHGRQVSSPEVLKGLGPFPVPTPHNNEVMSQLLVLECWKIKFLASAHGIDLRPGNEPKARQQKTRELARFVKSHQEEIKNFDWNSVKGSKLYQQLSGEITTFETNVREFARWAAKKYNDPKLVSEIEDFSFKAYLHFAVNILPKDAPAVAHIIQRNPAVAEDPNFKIFADLHNMHGCVPNAFKILEKNDTTSVWSFIRAYASAAARMFRTDLKLSPNEQGLCADQDFHMKHDELFDIRGSIAAVDMSVDTRISQVLSVIRDRKPLYQPAYNSTIYTLKNSIFDKQAILKSHADQLNTILGVADKLSGHAAPTYQELVDIWHLENMRKPAKMTVAADEWQLLKAREFTRYVLGKEQVTISVLDAVNDVLTSHSHDAHEKAKLSEGVERIAREEGIVWHPSHHYGSSATLTESQKTRVSKLDYLLDAKPTTKINDAIISVIPARNANLRVSF